MNREIVESFADMVKMKGIDKDVLAGILEEVFTLLVRKNTVRKLVVMLLLIWIVVILKFISKDKLLMK